MKKLFALLLALMLCGAAVAEAFALDNGVSWGMTQGDVLAIEGTSDVDYDTFGTLDELEVDDTAFKGAEADASYLFLSDALTMVSYEIDPEDAAPEALVARLDGEYGDHVEDGGKAYFDFMSRLTGTQYAAQSQVSGIGVNWTLPDGTLAMLLTGLEANEDDTVVIYVAPGLWGGADADLSEPAPALEP